MRSKVLQDLITLLAGHPVRGPAGFYAGPVLQQAVIFGHFGVTTSRKPERENRKSYVRYCVVRPTLLRVQTLTRSERHKRHLERQPHQPWRKPPLSTSLQPPWYREQTQSYSPISVHVSMCVLVIHYLLQVTFPEFQLSGQSFPVPLHGRLVSLLLRYQPFIVDDRI